MDGGAYNTIDASGVVASHPTSRDHTAAPISILTGRAVATHTPPNGAFRGFGAPQAMWAVERHMDRIARTLGIDPVEIRRRNILRDGDTTPTGQTLVDTGAEVVLNEALEAAKNPCEKIQSTQGEVSDGTRAGGVSSLVFHGCGFTGNGEARIKGKVALELSGRTVKILTASTDIGQGVDTTFPKLQPVSWALM